MSNWVQKNASFTIVSYTIFVATATWVTAVFLIDENKVHNARAVTEQYKAKLEVMESRIQELNKVNDRYLSWLNTEPKSFPSLEKRIKTPQTGINTTFQLY